MTLENQRIIRTIPPAAQLKSDADALVDIAAEVAKSAGLEYAFDEGYDLLIKRVVAALRALTIAETASVDVEIGRHSDGTWHVSCKQFVANGPTLVAALIKSAEE